MSFVPGMGMLRGMAFTLRKFFERKVTVQYPDQEPSIPPRHRGRLQLLYDDWGTLKCETCFQCAQACPIECIDMGGVDTRNRFHVHWGLAEQYAERREESALRRSGRPVPDAHSMPFQPVDLGPLETILEEEAYDPRRMLQILERARAAYGTLPVAVLKHISHSTGAWYAEVYGTASFYEHLGLQAGTTHELAVCRCPACAALGGGSLRAALEDTLGVRLGQVTPDGAVRLVAADCHGENDGAPYLTLDGKRQERPNPGAAAQLARSLLTATPAGRA